MEQDVNARIEQYQNGAIAPAQAEVESIRTSKEKVPDESKLAFMRVCDTSAALSADVPEIIMSDVGTLARAYRQLQAERDSLRKQVDKMAEEIKVAEDHAEALEQKYAGCPHKNDTTCACSYDHKNDVCAVHSPQVVELRKQLAAAHFKTKSPRIDARDIAEEKPRDYLAAFDHFRREYSDVFGDEEPEKLLDEMRADVLKMKPPPKPERKRRTSE
jgi:hypothetical protein